MGEVVTTQSRDDKGVRLKKDLASGIIVPDHWTSRGFNLSKPKQSNQGKKWTEKLGQQRNNQQRKENEESSEKELNEIEAHNMLEKEKGFRLMIIKMHNHLDEKFTMCKTQKEMKNSIVVIKSTMEIFNSRRTKDKSVRSQGQKKKKTHRKTNTHPDQQLQKIKNKRRV